MVWILTYSLFCLGLHVFVNKMEIHDELIPE